MDQKEMDLGRKPLKERTKHPDDALPHSIKHWIKVEAQAVFQEGTYCVREVSDMIGESENVVYNHVVDLYKAGCIELAGYKMVGNHRVPTYRAIADPDISDEEAQRMSIEERHDVSGAIAQAVLSEIASAYRNGKLDEDPVSLRWDAPFVDAQGEFEVYELILATWKKIVEISGDAANRMSESGEPGRPFFVGLLGFARGRAGRPLGGYMKIEK